MAAATSKMERLVIIVNGWKPLTIITKHSTLDVAAALHPPLIIASGNASRYHNCELMFSNILKRMFEVEFKKLGKRAIVV